MTWNLFGFRTALAEMLSRVTQSRAARGLQEPEPPRQGRTIVQELHYVDDVGAIVTTGTVCVQAAQMQTATQVFGGIVYTGQAAVAMEQHQPRFHQGPQSELDYQYDNKADSGCFVSTTGHQVVIKDGKPTGTPDGARFWLGNEEYQWTPEFGWYRKSDIDAEIKGYKLLKEWLNPKQLEEYNQHGWFIVDGKTRKYKIRKGRTFNVDIIDSDEGGRLCFLPQGVRAYGDIMLAQKLALENFESEALKVANIGT